MKGTATTRHTWKIYVLKIIFNSGKAVLNIMIKTYLDGYELSRLFFKHIYVYVYK